MRGCRASPDRIGGCRVEARGGYEDGPRGTDEGVGSLLQKHLSRSQDEITRDHAITNTQLPQHPMNTSSLNCIHLRGLNAPRLQSIPYRRKRRIERAADQCPSEAITTGNDEPPAKPTYRTTVAVWVSGTFRDSAVAGAIQRLVFGLDGVFGGFLLALASLGVLETVRRSVLDDQVGGALVEAAGLSTGLRSGSSAQVAALASLPAILREREIWSVTSDDCSRCPTRQERSRSALPF